MNISKVSEHRKREKAKLSPAVVVMKKYRIRINLALRELLEVKEGDYVDFFIDDGKIFVFKDTSGFRMNKCFIFCSKVLSEAFYLNMFPAPIRVSDYFEIMDNKKMYKIF